VESWVKQLLAPYGEYGVQLAPVCDQSFADKWQEIGQADAAGFSNLQDAYVKGVYFDAAYQNLINYYDFDVSGRFVLEQVLMSNSVQHGPTYGAEAFADGARTVGKNLSNMADAEIITALYNNKINDLSWMSGAPEDRPGLFARWQNERDMALSLLQDPQL
jgi:hypothetical protein